jgi:hypothetical protein
MSMCRSQRVLVAAAAFAALAGGMCVTAALADDAIPAYAQPAPAGTETIGGIILAYDGHFAVTLQDDRGFEDTIRLRNGTQIDPEGVRLHRGERVVIHGHADGNVFAADHIALDDSAAPGADQLYTDDGSYQYSAGYDESYGGYYGGGSVYVGGGYGGGYYGGGPGYGNGASNGQNSNSSGQLNRRPVHPYPNGGGAGGSTVRHTLGGGSRASAPASHPSSSSHR